LEKGTAEGSKHEKSVVNHQSLLVFVFLITHHIFEFSRT